MARWSGSIRNRILQRRISGLKWCVCATRSRRGRRLSAGAARRVDSGVRHCVFQCRESDSGADRSPRRRTGDPRGAGRQCRRPAAISVGREPASMRSGRCAWSAECGSDGDDPGALCIAFLGSGARPHRRFQHGVGRRALAIVAAVLLAFVPRLPSAGSAHGLGLSGSSLRVTGGTRRRLQVFVVTQIAASFLLLAGASTLLKTLLSLQARSNRASICAMCWPSTFP